MEGCDFGFEFWQRRQDDARAYQAAAVCLEERQKGSPAYPVVCRFWLEGQCSAGARCFYKHVYDQDMLPLCVYIDQPRCSEGAFCKFRHYYLPGEARGKQVRQDPLRRSLSQQAPRAREPSPSSAN